MPLLRLGFLHLAPVVGDLDGNRRLIEHGTTTAAEHGADWVLSGELVVSGYDFESLVGTDWIEPHPSVWLCRYAMLCGELNVSAFVSDPERTEAGLYNTAWAIGRNGEVLAAHRKLSPTPGSEDWSSPGSEVAVAEIDGIRVGMLLCADAYSPRPAARLSEDGADLIVSLAAWWPGPFGPNGEWEQRSRETGIPIVVCNRTGCEPVGDLTGAVSTVVANGRRLVELQSATSTLFVVDASLHESGEGMTAQLSEVIPLRGR